jgi:hypothetical protein
MQPNSKKTEKGAKKARFAILNHWSGRSGSRFPGDQLLHPLVESSDVDEMLVSGWRVTRHELRLDPASSNPAAYLSYIRPLSQQD